MKDLGFNNKLLHPRCWPTWVVVAIIYVLVCLPLSTQIRIGKSLGRLLPRVSPYRNKVLRTNISLCFGDKTPTERESIVRRALEATGVMYMETFHIYLRGVGKILDRSELIGSECLEQAQHQGRGVLLIGAHFTSLDVAGAIVGSHFDYDCVYRPHKNPVVEYLCRRARAISFTNVIPASDVPFFLKSLVKEKRIVWYGADQDLGHRRSVWVPFFGVEAATIKAPSKIASRYNPSVIFMSHHRDEENMRWIVKLEPIEDFPSGDCSIDAYRLNQIIEDAIKEHPEQYYWVHRRFKSLPNGDTRDYRLSHQ